MRKSLLAGLLLLGLGAASAAPNSYLDPSITRFYYLGELEQCPGKLDMQPGDLWTLTFPEGITDAFVTRNGIVERQIQENRLIMAVTAPTGSTPALVLTEDGHAPRFSITVEAGKGGRNKNVVIKPGLPPKGSKCPGLSAAPSTKPAATPSPAKPPVVRPNPAPKPRTSLPGRPVVVARSPVAASPVAGKPIAVKRNVVRPTAALVVSKPTMAKGNVARTATAPLPGKPTPAQGNAPRTTAAPTAIKPTAVKGNVARTVAVPVAGKPIAVKANVVTASKTTFPSISALPASRPTSRRATTVLVANTPPYLHVRIITRAENRTQVTFVIRNSLDVDVILTETDLRVASAQGRDQTNVIIPARGELTSSVALKGPLPVLVGKLTWPGLILGSGKRFEISAMLVL